LDSYKYKLRDDISANSEHYRPYEVTYEFINTRSSNKVKKCHILLRSLKRF